MKFLTFNNKYLRIVFHFVVIFDVQVFHTAAFRSPGVLLRSFRCLTELTLEWPLSSIPRSNRVDLETTFMFDLEIENKNIMPRLRDRWLRTPGNSVL